MKNTRALKFGVRVTYKDGKNEFIIMLTGEFYKFITRFNRTSHIESFKVEKIDRS